MFLLFYDILLCFYYYLIIIFIIYKYSPFPPSPVPGDRTPTIPFPSPVPGDWTPTIPFPRPLSPGTPTIHPGDPNHPLSPGTSNR